MARLQEKYRSEIVPTLVEKLNRSNILAVPRLKKIVVNMGVGDAPDDPKIMDAAMEELAMISGQKPSIRMAKKSIAGFKLREGQKIGCAVTLRGKRMYEFLDRLLNVAIPRIRDFRGIPRNSFDKQGNFTLGIREQSVFPEVNLDKVLRFRGLNVTMVIQNSESADDSRELLTLLGMPFRKN